MSRRSRPRKSAPKRSAIVAWLGRGFFLLTLFGLGLVLGLGGPWVWWLDREAGQRFAERQWTQASRVYARPLEIYAGMTLGVDDLLLELEAAGLQAGDPSSIGFYQRNGAVVDAHLHGFRFPDQRQAATRLQLRFSGNRLEQLRDGQGRDQGLVRVPPAELGHLMPLDERDRTLISLADFPPLLVTGIQAVEDRQFRHHHGLDPRGLLRAGWRNLRRGQVVQGGSTITQQLVKNLFLTPDRSLTRKFNEAVMALSIERRFSKAEILEAYLNEVYLGQDGGRAIHGFGRASEFYFGMPVQALAEDQIALLVGMVRGASWYHPQRNPERARNRRDLVLDMFLETGLIDRATREQVGQRALSIRTGAQRNARRHSAFMDLVGRQIRHDYRDRDLRGTGLRIFTTLAPSAQQHAEQALARGLRQVERQPNELQGAIVLVEPGSGEVRALVGDRQAGRQGFNRALDARRSIGSVIKPFVYLLALADGNRYSLLSTIDDAPLSVPVAGQEPWEPRNYDGISNGEVPLMEALARSLNQATVRVGLEVGLPALFRLLEQLGVAPRANPHPSAVLGALSLTPLQVAQLYQPLAAEGYSTPLRAITQVVDAGGRDIGRYPMRLRPIRERDALALLDYALRYAVTDGTGRSLAARLPGQTGIRGKTGTTNDGRDAWFVGYTRDWLGVVWTGRDDNAPAGITGAQTALPVWAELFSALPVRASSPSWPDSLEWYWVDWPSPLLANEQCENAVALPFIPGSQPTTMSSCMEQPSEERRGWFRRR